MKFTDEFLLEEVPKHNIRAISRLISISENGSPRAEKLQAELFKHSGNALVVGVTGSPGAGKSTLVDQLAQRFSKTGKKVAVLAIDPSSPFSGGAILGDRIRMTRSLDEHVFIRSMATRGALGGLSRSALSAIRILDAGGFDVIFVETVGVGQAEVDIVKIADTCVVVLVPGMGDSIQAIKAGILEIADHFIINKADREGADLLHKDLRVLISLGDHSAESWVHPILRTTATSGEGCDAVIESIEKHLNWLRDTDAGKIRREEIMRENIAKLTTDLIIEKAVIRNEDLLNKFVVECLERKLDPFTAARELVAQSEKEN